MLLFTIGIIAMFFGVLGMMYIPGTFLGHAILVIGGIMVAVSRFFPKAEG